MRTILTVKHPQDLTPEEYKASVDLTLRRNGVMAHSIRLARLGSRTKFKKTAVVSQLIRINRVSDGMLLGQALLDQQHHFSFAKPFEPFAQFYVRADFRRQGIGTRLIRKVDQISKKLGMSKYDIQYWDDRSEAFFRAVQYRDEIA